MKVAPRISLSEEERTTLNVWLRLPTPARLAVRAKIILLAADGRTNQEIARQLRVTRRTVSLWRRRFLERRLAGIEKEARSKRKSKVDEAAVRLILRKKERPANVTRWTIRSLAKELGVPSATLHRVWKAYGLDRCRE